MNRGLLYRGLLILAVVGGAAFAAYPLSEKIHLGLDLRGGMHLVLQVKTQDAVNSELTKDMDRLVEQAKEEAITDLHARTNGDHSFAVTNVPAGADAKLADIAKAFRTTQGNATWEVKRQGEELVFTMVAPALKEIERLAVKQALETINNRINAYGVTEPTIVPVGDSDRIVVQLPGVDDPERVKTLIKQTAFLEFRLTDFPHAGGRGVSREAILNNYNGNLPDNVEILEGSERDSDGKPLYFAVEKRDVVTGRDLKTARPTTGQFQEPVVSFSFTHDGGERFGEATGANVGRGLGIVLDHKVVSAPVIESRITNDGIIRGNFTRQEVDDLSMVLRSGALPAGITYLEERTVGPSLGKDSIRQGLRAGLIGSLLVVLTMLVMYRLSGINAIAALALNIALVFGALGFFHATLTLPGIAGIVLTIGMAVDANVLIFERIKEELRVGRTVKSAIETGFAKALSSIVDANVTTLIAALFLFQFGTGPIRGFAVTLSVGILASLFTAIFVSRWIFDLTLAGRERVERLSI
jgi:preprotein translocase subunit SecD